MESLHRLFTLDRLFHSHKNPIPTQTLLDQLECSSSTFKRLIRVLREQYNYPIAYSKQYEGYFYDKTNATQVSGLWFTTTELQAILIIQGMLQQLQPGFLGDYFQPLLGYIEKTLLSKGESNPQLKRIKIVPIAHQYIPGDIFSSLCQTTLNNWRITVHYCDIHGKASQRELSPQGLIYYRNNWYLDAWCHLRQGLRTFWVPGIQSVEIGSEKGQVINEESLRVQLESSYGIFDGAPTQMAHLRFTGRAAMRVNKAQWHPMQRQQVNEDGSLDMWLPYSDHRELVMDILRYGAEAEVLAPQPLRSALKKELQRTIARYDNRQKVSP